LVHRNCKNVEKIGRGEDEDRVNFVTTEIVTAVGVEVEIQVVPWGRAAARDIGRRSSGRRGLRWALESLKSSRFA
jgi:hypothetical protein